MSKKIIRSKAKIVKAKSFIFPQGIFKVEVEPKDFDFIINEGNVKLVFEIDDTRVCVFSDGGGHDVLVWAKGEDKE